jgi:hypothetical protein
MNNIITYVILSGVSNILMWQTTNNYILIYNTTFIVRQLAYKIIQHIYEYHLHKILFLN